MVLKSGYFENELGLGFDSCHIAVKMELENTIPGV